MASVSEKSVGGFISVKDLLAIAMICIIGYGAYALVGGGAGGDEDEWGNYNLKVSAFCWITPATAPRMDSSSVSVDFISGGASLGRSVLPGGVPTAEFVSGNMVFVVYGRYRNSDRWLRGRDVHSSFDSHLWGGKDLGKTVSSTMDLKIGALSNHFGESMEVFVIFVGKSIWEQRDTSDPSNLLVDSAYKHFWVNIPDKDSSEWS